MGIATTKTGTFNPNDRRDQMEKTFLPIVQPEKMRRFLKVWDKWLVLSNRIEEEKFPGKLKVRDK